MTKPTALLVFLWKQNLPFLASYLRRNPRTVLLFSEFFDAEAVRGLEATGSQVKLFEVKITPALHDGAAKAASLAKDAVARRGLPPDLPPGMAQEGLPAVHESTLAAFLPSIHALLHGLQEVENAYFIEAALLNEESLWLGKTVTGWARERGIPSIHLSHGTGVLKNYNFEDYDCDCIAVFGERGAEYYLDSGVAKERIDVVGNPNWGSLGQLKQRKNAVRREMCARHGLDPNAPVVMFGTAWNADLSLLDDRDLMREIRDFLAVYAPLAANGLALQLIVKDRLLSGQGAGEAVSALAQDMGIPAGRVVYALTDTQSWLASADVVVSIDSNISIEAILLETPAINLITPFGLLAGPAFGPGDPIVHCEPAGLADAIREVLSSAPLREQLQQQMRAAGERFDRGVDGRAEARLGELIEKKRRIAAANESYVWQTLIEAEDTDATQYHNWPRSELVDLVVHPPRRVLDIGCAAGKTGEYIKQKYPRAKVFGVEQNLAAARLAAGRLDSVFAGKFEDFDFAAHGIGPGSLDTVIVADVLEHIYNPWDVLVRLKPYLAPDAQILASIPNTRNLALMKDLADGHWRYEAWGLLDVTHIRFFTLQEIRRFFQETGYRVVRTHYNLDGRLSAFYQQNVNKPLFNIDFDKFTLKNVNQDELVELCTLQFFVVAEVGALANETFEAREKVLEQAREARTAYEQWLDARRLTRAQGDLYEQRMAGWATRPVFHLAIVAGADDEERVGASIQSLASQYYHELRLTLVSSAQPPAGWADSPRLAWLQTGESDLLDGASRALTQGGGDWVGMIDAGDTVAPHSFLFLAEAINAHPDWHFIYTDEDVVSAAGRHEMPQFKPDFNLDLLRSTAYTGSLAVVSRPLFERVGGFLSASMGAEDHDLALRAYEAAGAAAIGHLADVLYHRRQGASRWPLAPAAAVEAGKRAVEAHLARSGLTGAVEQGLFPGSYRVRYSHRRLPRVSILIAMREQVAMVQRCIETVLGKTDYPDYEILLMDGGSSSADALAYLDGLKALGEERIRVYSRPAAAGLPQLHNMLAQEARGDYLLFLHFDAAVLQEDWLASLMAHALRPEVGMVAPRLLKADGTVGQAGLVLGLNRTVDSPFRGEAMDAPGYQGRAHLEQDFSALGGGCLLVRKSLFAELGGFDAERFPGQFAEADFSRKVAGRGLLAVWTPFASVLCEGGAERVVWRDTPVEDGAVQAACEAETDRFYLNWLPQLARDPAYNANLSLEQGRYFSVETRAPLTWDPLPWRPLPRVLAQPADNQGCGEYRIISPMRALTEAGRVQGWADFHLFSAPEMERLDVDAIILQRQTLPEQIRAIARHKKFSRALRVYELDDLLIKIPMKSIHNALMPKDIARKLRQAVALCDRFVVSTEPLREAYKDYHSDIRVVPNFIERARWGGLAPLRNRSAKPRVGWAGGIGHAGDLEMVSSVVKALADQVDWVFMGMCPDQMRPWIKEFHPGVPVEQFPARLASLNLDLAIAPLEHNPFNEAKSHLRLLEYGILGYPVVCSDAYPYRGDFPVTRVRNRHKDWADAILAQISDPGACAQQGDRLREHVESNWMLEDNLDVWMRAWLP